MNKYPSGAGGPRLPKSPEAFGQIQRTGRLLLHYGFVKATDGNISICYHPGILQITASGAELGHLTPDLTANCDLSGKILGRQKPSSEYRMHIAVYNTRPDLHALIHAHPPWTIALNLAGYSIPADTIPELMLTLGEVPTAKFAAPGSQAGADAAVAAMKSANAITLDRHGSLTAGANLHEAFYNLERMEFAAKTTLLALQISPGGIKKLTKKQIEEVREAAKLYHSADRPNDWLSQARAPGPKVTQLRD